MKYSLKGLVQFKGFSHVLKFPFSEVGLGKAMKPWITEDLLNKIADELIIKTQNMVLIAKSIGDEYDVFLMDVRAKDFNENYRQGSLDLLNSLVKKHINTENIEYSSSLYNDVIRFNSNLQQEESLYKFFNPNTTMNAIRSKIAGKDCDVWARAQTFTKGFKEILDGLNISRAFMTSINDVNIYSFNESWVNQYNAKEVNLSDLLDGITQDLMGDSHQLGKYAIAWCFALSDKINKHNFLIDLSLKVTNLLIHVGFPTHTNKIILDSIYGIGYQRELEALGTKNLFASTLYQSYVNCTPDKALWTAKDALLAEAFSLYWERVKTDNFEGIDFEAIKTFFIENKNYSADSGNFLKIYIFQVMSALTLGNKPNNLILFDRCFTEIVPIFDKLFQKHLALEFARFIERSETSNSLPFGMKIVDDFSEFELSGVENELLELSHKSEVYVCKPGNAKMCEVFFFNDNWADDLKLKIYKRFKKLNHLA